MDLLLKMRRLPLVSSFPKTTSAALIIGIFSVASIVWKNCLRDRVVPRLWYVKTLLRLKRTLYVETGSGKLEWERIFKFVQFYDNDKGNLTAHRIMPTAMDFTAYAIKQLVGINGMWWILYAFVPSFLDEKKLFLFGRRLRYMMVKYAMVPKATPCDSAVGALTRNVDLLHCLRRFISEAETTDEKHCPTVPMEFAQVQLKVTYLPLYLAVQHEEPPLFGQQFLERPLSWSDPAVQDVIPIFVSHRWLSPNNPNHGNDFVNMQRMLVDVIQNAIQSCILLLRCDFPLEMLVMRQRKSMRRCFAFRSFNFDQNPDMYDEHGELIKAPQISGAIASAIFIVTAGMVLSQWQDYENTQDETRRRWKTLAWNCELTKRIWLWYDYSSLPQHDHRDRDPALRKRFNMTLDNLSEIQQRAHTLCMNASPSYNNRAWCMAEYINAERAPLDGRCEYGHVGGTDVTSPDVVLSLRAFILLLDPTVTLSELLARLGLEFTNQRHETKNLTTICWIMWNSILRRKGLKDDFYSNGGDGKLPARLRVGSGEPLKIIEWLNLIRNALSSTYAEDPPPISMDAMRRGGEDYRPLDYGVDLWVETRGRAGLGSEQQVQMKEIVVPFAHKKRYGHNYFEDSLALLVDRLELLEARKAPDSSISCVAYLEDIEHGQRDDERGEIGDPGTDWW